MVKAAELEELRRLAKLDEPRAQLALAWEYWRGEHLPKDIDAATAQLRHLELTDPELARFNLAKMKYLEEDISFVEDIRRDCVAGFGPSLYLMGVYSKRRVGGDKGLSDAIEYFRTAAQHGHLPSEYLVWRLSKLGLWRRLATAIPAHLTLIRSIVISWHDIDDLRILT